MAKLGGSKRTLQDFTVPYSLEPGGKVYNLSKDLQAQQSVVPGKTDFFTGGGQFTFSGGPALYTSAPFSPPALDPPTAGLKLTRSVKLDFPNTNKFILGQGISFTTQELTLSIWVSGSTFTSSIPGLQTEYILQVSGTEGIQFALGRWDQTSAGQAYHFAISALTSSGLSPVVVATSTRTAGRSSAEIGFGGGGNAYRGRYYQLHTPPVAPVENPLSNLDPGWRHVVYVQRAASEPETRKQSGFLPVPSTPFDMLSKTGNEGRCELWLDGELVYNTPAYGPFPQGHSPFFIEDGVAGLLGSQAYRGYAPAPGSIQNRTLRQPGAVPFISGTDGDAIAQLAVWRRCLSPEEISSIYRGQIEGVYTTPITSVSSSPKRLLTVDNQESSYFKNAGFNDFVASPQGSAFSERDPAQENIDKLVYQGNNYANLPVPLIRSEVIGDGTTQLATETISAFNDTVDVTNATKDEEFVIPSGSAAIRIKIPNLDTDTVAARTFNSGILGETFPSQVVISPESGFVGTGFLYYSPLYRKWVEKRAASETSFTPDTNLISSPESASNFVKQAKQHASVTTPVQYSDPFMLSSRIMAQFAWSPQFGYFVNHVEHLQQAGYERIGWPTSMFNAPNAPKYHGYEQETFKMRDYIDRPFLLKRIEMKVPVKAERVFGANPRYDAAAPGTYGDADDNWNNQITNKKDIDNYVFFVYKQKRVSRDRDGKEDRFTSKRYLIASASICYYNSGSFGGAWNDGFISSSDATVNPHQTKWTSAGKVYDSLAKPDDSSDYYGLNITRISGSNCVLHNPQYAFDWNQPRFTTTADGTGPHSVTGSDSRVLNLTMLPHVVPACAVAPSLIPVTASFSWQSSFTVSGTPYTPFQLREGGTTGKAGKGAFVGMYVSTGSRASANQSSPAPYLTLFSNRWFGGTRPPLLAAGTATGGKATGNLESDPYDAVLPLPSNLTINPGTVDAFLTYAPAWAYSGSIESTTLGWEISKIVLNRSPAQCHGISINPAASKVNGLPNRVLKEKLFTQQISLDADSVNSITPTSNEPSFDLHGRKSLAQLPPNNYGLTTNNTYMGLYGWRFISSFQMSDYSAEQTYSPALLHPDDELILGLDAGTFGPPDLDSSDQDVFDNVLNTLINNVQELDETSPPPPGLREKRFHKLTHLREDYRLTMPHSRLRILSGDAELVLIGDFLENDTVKIPQRSSPIAGSISSYYGDAPISDVSYLYSPELMSGSLFTRVFTGSEGPTGVLDGNNDPSLARRFYLDLGARRQQ